MQFTLIPATAKVRALTCFECEELTVGKHVCPRHDRHAVLGTYIESWTWALMLADGTVVCYSGGKFDSEEDARSNIAAAKKSMKGAWHCKVVMVNDPA